ncbi:MAG: hypothetical protein ACK4UK_07805, partial [Flavobacterium sp.]
MGGGSFKVEIDLGTDRIVTSGNPLCEGDNYTLDATQPGNNSYQWFFNGNLINGAVNPTYEVSTSGTYSVIVLLENSSCEANGSVEIEFVSVPDDQTTQLISCEINGSGQANYNLLDLNPLFIGNDNSLTISYFAQLNDALNQTNPISQPNSYIANPETIYGVVKNNFGCRNLVTISLEFSNNSLNIDPLPVFCDDFGNTTDGIRVFNFMNEISPVIENQIGLGYTFQYFLDNSLSVLLPNSYQNEVPNLQTIYVKVSEGINCIDIIALNLEVFAFDEEPGTSSIGFCEGNPVTLTAPFDSGSYLWSTGETTQEITVTSSGTYQVAITSSQNCSQTQTYVVTTGITPQSAQVIVMDFSGNQNSIEVIVSPPGNYTYSIDGLIFQDSNIF